MGTTPSPKPKRIKGRGIYSGVRRRVVVKYMEDLVYVYAY